MIMMAEKIVTHKNPDLDAITAMWLLIRFDQSRYGDAHLEFTPAGETYKNAPVDTDPDVVHVDNGRGRFDHHSPGGYETCAAKLVYEHLVSEGLISPSDRAIEEMVAFSLDIDRFADFAWTEPFSTRYSYILHEVIPVLHSLQTMDNEAVARYVFVYLDGVYQRLKMLHEAQDEIVQGTSFEWAGGEGTSPRERQ